MKNLLFCLLLPILLTACAHTTYRGADGAIFTTNGDIEEVAITRSGIVIKRMNHSGPQRAIAETVSARGNAAVGILGALGTAMLIH